MLQATRKEAMRTVVTTVLAVAIAVGVTMGVSSPAFAAGGIAPACITRLDRAHSGDGSFDIRNDCGKPMRVKVALAMRPDTECRTLAPNEVWNIGPWRYQKTLVC